MAIEDHRHFADQFGNLVSQGILDLLRLMVTLLCRFLHFPGIVGSQVGHITPLAHHHPLNLFFGIPS